MTRAAQLTTFRLLLPPRRFTSPAATISAAPAQVVQSGISSQNHQPIRAPYITGTVYIHADFARSGAIRYALVKAS